MFIFKLQSKLKLTSLLANNLYEEKILILDISAGSEPAFKNIFQQYASSLIDFWTAQLSAFKKAWNIFQYILNLVLKGNIHVIYFLKVLFAAIPLRIIVLIGNKIEQENHTQNLQASALSESAMGKISSRLKEVCWLSREKYVSIKVLDGYHSIPKNNFLIFKTPESIWP